MNIWTKLLGVAVVMAAAFFLVTMYGKAQYSRGAADERTAWTKLQVGNKQKELDQYKAGVASVLGADKQYIETVREKIIPITKTIVERTTEYAQTAEGSSLCLPADRVREITQFTSGLFDTPPSELLDTGVPTNTLDSQP